MQANELKELEMPHKHEVGVQHCRAFLLLLAAYERLLVLATVESDRRYCNIGICSIVLCIVHRSAVLKVPPGLARLSDSLRLCSHSVRMN